MPANITVSECRMHAGIPRASSGLVGTLSAVAISDTIAECDPGRILQPSGTRDIEADMRIAKVLAILVFGCALGTTIYFGLLVGHHPFWKYFHQWTSLVLHASAFAFLAFFGLLAWPRRRLAVALFLFAGGCLIELLQTITPHRSASLVDVGSDVLGIALGLAVYLFASQLAKPIFGRHPTPGPAEK